MKLKKILATSGLMLISSAVYAQYDTVVMCRACPAGYVGNGSGAECTACAGGTYQNQTGQSSCITCTAGTYSSGKTMACQTCPAGTYSGTKASSCTTCTAGTYSGAGASSCSTCPAGKYSGAGASSCSTCPAGTYSGKGASSCTPCSYPYYQPYAGQSSCPYSCDTSTPSCTETKYEAKYSKDRVNGCLVEKVNGECPSDKVYCVQEKDCVKYKSSSKTKYGTANSWTSSSCTGGQSASCSSERKPTDYCGSYHSCD